jgi:hypothetical protein
MSVINDDGRTHAWQTGDPITHRDSGITGFAKWTYPRKTDGKKFLRVQITSGKRAGYEDWADSHWMIGQGKHQLTCRDCGYPFRTNHLDDLWCPCCQRSHAPKYDATATSAAHQRARLFGNATRGFETPPREATPEELAATAEQRRRDQEESPF